ncbi:redoxin family protein [Pseudoteredinibacter isoporae]|uniref:Thiol-disulfide isomerase/thioredoxin n=1 Tax=Pseudoteredinibacter isoporae TaxID=570281 RepID=A0A7X0JTB1_9GAMM|nr:redoxin family protein [Pseudoteredinibacter isoporae]MBB6521893.1 thiol-disulfide isomerase/thioredoxin [Pseudoteredinibacter isoporae]NHO87437.1 redoxin family protein [Pseudoteredinibacter isoporae]NIB24232.1 redoxin family protein [Pseudoteredinibacter isoporae]
MKPLEIYASEWLNCAAPLSLEKYRGKVVVVTAFQMLCPACVSHSLPQAMDLSRTFSNKDVQVIGLHTVFEHHDAMDSNALKAFLQEYRISIPVAIDQAQASGTPRTMSTWGLSGTPSLLIFGPGGELRLRHFGLLPDVVLGHCIGRLNNGHSSTDNPANFGSNTTAKGCRPGDTE